jgi:3-hydroxyisobutyrate dehydrogenase
MAADQNRPTTGFIGLGGMGSRMARRLLDAGYPMRVWNRTREKAEPFRQRGAFVAATPRELAEGADVILSMVADDAAIESAYFGDDGALAGAKSGATVIEMSTIYPATSVRLHEAAADRGCDALDAPVSGTLPHAESGELVIFVGGDEETLERRRPILEVLGKSINYMGPAGAGATMKLSVNALMGTAMQALAEAIALGERAGLDRTRLIDALSQTGVVSPSQKPRLQMARSNDYRSAFPLRLMFKDYTLIARQAMELPVPMPATAVAHQICAAAKDLGDDNADFSVVIRVMEVLSTPHRAATAPP